MSPPLLGEHRSPTVSHRFSLGLTRPHRLHGVVGPYRRHRWPPLTTNHHRTPPSSVALPTFPPHHCQSPSVSPRSPPLARQVASLSPVLYRPPSSTSSHRSLLVAVPPRVPRAQQPPVGAPRHRAGSTGLGRCARPQH
jgi:hypothetical protein